MTQRLDYAAIAPAGTKALGSVYGYIMQSGLPRQLVNLVYLRASQINGCAYSLPRRRLGAPLDGATNVARRHDATLCDTNDRVRPCRPRRRHGAAREAHMTDWSASL
jgi:hypothetical protein